MKRPTLSPCLTLAAACALWANPVFAQQPAPQETQPAPATQSPAESKFKDDKERRSYGLGAFLGSREKANAENTPERGKLNADEIIAGLKDGLDSVKSQNYAAGLTMAVQIKRSGVDIDPAVLIEALRANLGDAKDSKMDAAEVQAVMRQINSDLQEKQKARQKAEAEKNLAIANEFLEKNKTEEGVTTTPTGLQYKIETPGDGKQVEKTDLVTLNLVGSVPGGQEFERNPAGVPSKRLVSSLVKGLQEGLQLLKVGGKARFWVPPALGYGETRRGAALGPNSVLIFDVEVVAAEPAPQPPPRTSPIVDSEGNIVRDPNAATRRGPTAVTPPVSVEIPATPPQPAPGATPPAPAPRQPGAPPAPEQK